FPGAGTTAAHNLPLVTHAFKDVIARELFNTSAQALYVPRVELEQALATLTNHQQQGRSLESQNPLVHRQPPAPSLPEPKWQPVGNENSAMTALDDWFVKLVKANPNLRVRVGNPDELASNKMGETLALLKHRVNEPELGVPEDLHGARITACNEEDVSAA